MFLRAFMTKPASEKAHRVCTFLYNADLVIVEALRERIGTRSRSVIVRMALRELQRKLEREQDGNSRALRDTS